MVTKEMLKNALTQLGVEKGMVLEVHSSLSSFGEIEGGAETVINTLKEIVTEEGSIFMPALRLSRELSQLGALRHKFWGRPSDPCLGHGSSR